MSARWSATQLIFFPDRPGLTSVQHTTSHTAAIQPHSPNQWYIPIGKQWYQLPEFIPSNTDSGLHRCISISIHIQHITQVAELIHYLQICTGSNIHTCMTCTFDYRTRATSTNTCKWLHHFVYATLCTTTLHLCTYFWQLQLVHCIELLPTPLPHTPHSHLAAFCTGFWRSPLIITLVLFIIYSHTSILHIILPFSYHSQVISITW